MQNCFSFYIFLIHSYIPHFAGHQLHDVHVNIIGNGTNYPCGFYPGPAITGDHIVFLCRNGSVGNSIKIQISSKDGQTDWLSVCEVEVYGTSWGYNYVQFYSSFIYILTVLRIMALTLETTYTYLCAVIE